MRNSPAPDSPPVAASDAGVDRETGFFRELGLFDSVMIVIGVMVGSGIFIVPADMARNLGSAGWVLIAWLFAGILTISAALSYGELAAMIPKAGGVYVYLREAFSPAVGFLYGWTLFTVIQTGTIAAVAVAFSRFLGVLWPAVSEQAYLLPPVSIGSRYAISLSTAQLVAVAVIALLTWTNVQGIRYGKLVQNVFTSAKLVALAALILLGLVVGRNSAALQANFTHPWAVHGAVPVAAGLSALTALGLLVAIGVSQSGALFSADAWHDITFAAGEVRRPSYTVPRALALGTISVISIYLLANLAYLSVLPLPAIQHAPADRVATAMLEAIVPGLGSVLMALAIMVSTFGCVNSLVLAGARVYHAMAADGLFFPAAARLNRAHVPGWSLAAQGVWSAALVLPRTVLGPGQYGNLYSNLLDYVISAALLFYILAILAVFYLRFKWPSLPRPYRAWGYPLVPAFYLVGAGAVLICLFLYRASTSWPGLAIVLIGLPLYWVIRTRSRTS